MNAKLFGGDRDKEFKWAIYAFVGMFLLIIVVFGMSLIFRAEGFNKACQAVQDNNKIFTTYLTEAQDRSIVRYEHEVEEGLDPPFTREEIEAQISPLLDKLKPINC